MTNQKKMIAMILKRERKSTKTIKKMRVVETTKIMMKLRKTLRKTQKKVRKIIKKKLKMISKIKVNQTEEKEKILGI